MVGRPSSDVGTLDSLRAVLGVEAPAPGEAAVEAEADAEDAAEALDPLLLCVP